MGNQDPMNQKFRKIEDLPQELSWDNMEKGIYEKMETQTEVPVPFKYLASFSIISFCLILVFTFVYLNQFISHNAILGKDYAEETQSTISKKVLSQLNANELSVTNHNDFVPSEEKEIKQAALSLKPNANENSGRDHRDVIIENEDKREKSTVINKGVDQQPTNQIKPNSHQNLINKNADDPATTLTLATPNSSGGVIIKKEIELDKIVDQKEISLIETIKLKSLKHAHQALNISLSPNIIELVPIGKTRKLSVSLGTSFLLLKNNFGGSILAEAKNKYEKGGTGYSSEIDVQYKLDSNWSISLGLSLTKLISKFDYYSVTDTIVEKNVLIENRLNLIDGSNIEIYEDRLLPGKSWREVIHHNHLSYLSLPVVLSRNLVTKNNMNFGVGLGAYINIFGQASGKTLYTKNAADTDFVIGMYAEERFKLEGATGFISNVYGECLISEKISIGGMVEYQKSLVSLNQDQSFFYKPGLFGINLFLRYHL